MASTDLSSSYTYAPASPPARDLRDLPPNVNLYLRRASLGARAHLAAWLAEYPGINLHLDAAAAGFLTALGRGGPRRLTLGRGSRVPARLTPLLRVESLTFYGATEIREWLCALPSVRFVRMLLHGDDLDAALVNTPALLGLSLAEGTVRNVAALPSTLRSIELRDVRVDDFDSLARLPELRGLRLARVARCSSIEALAGHPTLSALVLEDLPHLERLDVLGTLQSLQSIQLQGLWQFTLADAAVLYAVPMLARATVDIGGRRKNVEILRRLRLPAARPFDLESICAGAGEG